MGHVEAKKGGMKNENTDICNSSFIVTKVIDHIGINSSHRLVVEYSFLKYNVEGRGQTCSTHWFLHIILFFLVAFLF